MQFSQLLELLQGLGAMVSRAAGLGFKVGSLCGSMPIVCGLLYRARKVKDHCRLVRQGLKDYMLPWYPILP